MIQVTILGCSSATPTVDRHPSAQLIHVGETKVLIDCGEGTQTQMFKYHIKYNKIDYILISHLHGDHFLGLPGLLSTMSLNGRQKAMTIICPEPLHLLLNQFLQVSETQLQFPIEYIYTIPDRKNIIIDNEHIYISSFPLKHRIPCTGFIIKEKKEPRKIIVEKCVAAEIPIEYYPILKRGKNYIGIDGRIVPNEELTEATSAAKSYAYCSDTIFDEEIVSYIEKIDLLYHEATFAHQLLQRAEETFHSTALQAGYIAQKAGVKQLIIGHFSARYNQLERLLTEAKSNFAETTLAIEGATFTI